MKFESSLIKGTLIKRYKRFLADVTLENGTIVTAHVANPGSMLELSRPGSTIWLEFNNNPKRKLKYSWKLIETKNTFIGVDTHNANKIVKEALDNDSLNLNQKKYQSEVKYGENSRVDFLLFLVQRSDGDLFNIAEDIDPNYNKSYKHAIKSGVKVLCYDCVISKVGITIGKRLDLANASNSV